MRTHVEVDPGMGMTGFDGAFHLIEEYPWAIDIEICVFPQEGLLNNPGTDEVMVEALRRGVRVVGAAPSPIATDHEGEVPEVLRRSKGIASLHGGF